MRIPITKYGLPQAAFYPALTILVMILITGLLPVGLLFWLIEAILAIIFIWILSFFRDPKRQIPSDENLILSPADGTISDIEEVDEPNFIKGKATRIGIFLSIFNVHINRTPCRVKIGKITYHKGRFINALNPLSGKINESNDIEMTRLDNPNIKLLVRQISGAIARRIVCDTKEGQEFAGGAVFGMLKFGSRTEIYLPADFSGKIIVKKGDKVKAGLTILARLDEALSRDRTKYD